MPDIIGNFLAPDRASIDHDRYVNALSRNQVQRLPQANQMQDLNIRGAQQDIAAQGQKMTQESAQNARGMLARQFALVAQHRDPTAAYQAMIQDPNWQAAAKANGIDPSQFTYDPRTDTPDSIRQSATQAASVFGYQAPDRYQTEQGPGGSLIQTNTNTGQKSQVLGREPKADPNAGPLTQDEAGIVDQIGQYRIIPSARLQATPRGQMILAEVEKKYPNYDISTAQAKVGAARAFTSGKEGAMLRSIGTANKHLNMLGQMVDALDGGNLPVLNRLSNAWTTETGGDAVTNFDSAKEIVGQEVVKAIVANGGGVAEREEAQRKLDAAKSPRQLRGVISTYRAIMDAQQESLLQQRSAAGLSDSTTPDYTEGAKPGSGGWTVTEIK